ncbi:tetratricopeptide repeat protein [Actinobacillus lignieresii]|nr:tetratricopeptide repeat protein [Actinobacillus lignieresii]
MDRALRIHQALDASPDYSIEQKLLAKQQLAKDFMAAGFYDRAENYYIMLLDEPEFAVNSLTQLMTVYQKTKEWKKAINVAEKLIKIEPDTDKIPLSHYYCEYAQAIKNEDLDGHLSALSKALEYSPQCARASILLGDYYLAQNQFQSALKNYERILQQDPDFISEVIEKIKACYMAENDLANYELFLIRANQIKHNSSVDLALAEYIEQKDGVVAAHSKLYQQLSQYPSMITFHRFIHYQINEAEEGRAKESLMLLYNMVGARMKKGFQYRCLNCGYQSYRLSWHCPSCRQWEQIKPIHSIDSQIN